MGHILHADGRYRLDIKDKHNVALGSLDNYVTKIYDMLELTEPVIVTVDTDIICVCVTGDAKHRDTCTVMFYPGAGKSNNPSKIKTLMMEYHNVFPNKSTMYLTVPADLFNSRPDLFKSSKS